MLPFWQYVKSDAAQGEPPQMAWQKQSWTAASGGPLEMEGQCGGTLEDPESTDDGGRRPDLGTGLPVSWQEQGWRVAVSMWPSRSDGASCVLCMCPDLSLGAVFPL